MSNLNPGGYRGGGGGRVFGARQIARACETNRRADVDKPSKSPVGQPHQHSREVQRRLRQQARGK